MLLRILVIAVLTVSTFATIYAQSIYWEKRTILNGPMTVSTYPGAQACRDSQGNTYIAGLAEAICESHAASTEDHELQALLAELETLSDDEAQRQFATERAA